MANRGTVSISSAILTDVMKKYYGSGTFYYEPANDTEKWVYKSTIVDNTSQYLFDTGGHQFIEPKTTTTRSGDLAGADKIKFLYIHHTATSDGSTSTNESILLTLDDTTVEYNEAKTLEIPRGTSWFARLPNTRLDKVKARTATSSLGANGSGNVYCKVYAIIDDI